MTASPNVVPPSRLRWALASLPLAVIVTLAHFACEWLFQITRPSPVAGLTFPAQLEVLIESPIPYFWRLLGTQAVATAISMVAFPRFRQVALVPASVIGGLLLLVLIDNFTYTLFGFGVLTSGTFLRMVYAAVLPGLVVFAGWKLSETFPAWAGRRGVAVAGVVLALLFAVVPAVPMAMKFIAELDPTAPPPVTSKPPASRADLPNILFLGSDGVSAKLMSVYGYQRDTTPFLKQFRDESLFFENAFANNAKTHGSLVTLLTGRLPLSTHVTFPPTVLQGEDSRRNLPLVLKELGYTTLQLGLRHYADAEDTNMVGFDALNYRWLRVEDIRPGKPSATATDVFRGSVASRVVERVGHLFGFRNVADVFAHVEGRQPAPEWSDDRRVETLIRYFDTASEPWFAHVHLDDTHCCYYRPKKMVFTGSPEQYPNPDARDSKIYEADGYIRTLVDALRVRGRLDNTIVVIYSDHAEGWKTTDRVPLIIRFPGAKPRARVSANVQLADVAPTVLDYLKVPVPDWMDGVSLLHPEQVPANRPVFGVSELTENEGQAGLRVLVDAGPPNYGAAQVMVVTGNRWVGLNLSDGSLVSEPVAGHTGTGPGVSDEEARALILGKLAEHGFRTMAR